MEFRAPKPQAALAKFGDPNWTAKGERRAEVALERLETLWFNTGTLCNIECINCYIESSPKNDRLVYITAGEVRALLDEITELDLGTREIGFTGGEPFMNPDMLDMLDDALARGFEVLLLTNAMQPMQRPRIKKGLLELGRTLRRQAHRTGQPRSLFASAARKRARAENLANWRSRASTGWPRTAFRSPLPGARAGMKAMPSHAAATPSSLPTHGWSIDPENRSQLVLLPEMDGSRDVPEITTACWSILGKDFQPT